MKKITLLGFIVSLMAIFFFSLYCSKNKPTEPSYGEGIDENVKALDKLVQEPSCEETPISAPSIVTTTIDNQHYIVTTRKYKRAAEFDEQLALDPTTDVIWLGAMIDAATIPTGQYVPIAAKRAPLTLSISLVNIDGIKSKTVAEPKLSTIREAIGEILAQDVTGATDARVTSSIEDVYSEEQLKIAVRASYKSGFGSIKGQFDFNNQEIKTRILVKFMQVYYTIDIDIPEKPSDFFASSVKWDDLKSQISAYTSPMYVSTIAYGRMALFSFESTDKSTDVTAAVKWAFGNLEGSISAEYEKILNSSTIKATIIGGSGASAVGAINGFEGIKKYILTGGDYDKNTAAAPLSYKLRYLKDNSIGNIILSSEYNIVEYKPLKIEFYDDETKWRNAVTASGFKVVEWKTTAENISKSNEYPSFPGKNQNLGSKLTWEKVTTDSLSFILKNNSVTPGDSLGLVYWDANFPEGTISIGDDNNRENDDFDIRTMGLQIYAIAFDLADNAFDNSEKMVVACVASDPTEEVYWQEFPSNDEQHSFIGVISPLPLGRISFDEKDDYDDIYIKDFKFGVLK